MKIEINHEQLAYLKTLNSDKKKRKFLLDAILENLLKTPIAELEEADERDWFEVKKVLSGKSANGHLSTRHKAKPEDIISGTEDAYREPLNKKP